MMRCFASTVVALALGASVVVVAPAAGGAANGACSGCVQLAQMWPFGGRTAPSAMPAEHRELLERLLSDRLREEVSDAERRVLRQALEAGKPLSTAAVTELSTMLREREGRREQRLAEAERAQPDEEQTAAAQPDPRQVLEDARAELERAQAERQRVEELRAAQRAQQERLERERQQAARDERERQLAEQAERERQQAAQQQREQEIAAAKAAAEPTPPAAPEPAVVAAAAPAAVPGEPAASVVDVAKTASAQALEAEPPFTLMFYDVPAPRPL